jgi:hypothetical protein
MAPSDPQRNKRPAFMSRGRTGLCDLPSATLAVAGVLVAVPILLVVATMSDGASTPRDAGPVLASTAH